MAVYIEFNCSARNWRPNNQELRNLEGTCLKYRPADPDIFLPDPVSNREDPVPFFWCSDPDPIEKTFLAK